MLRPVEKDCSFREEPTKRQDDSSGLYLFYCQRQTDYRDATLVSCVLTEKLVV